MRDSDLRDLAAHVDVTFYHAHNPDIAAAGLDAVTHYARTGWREGRNPNPWFDTSHYLTANPDVRDSGVNPLLHYIRQGKSEGRATVQPGGGGALLEVTPEPAWIDAAPPDAAVLAAEDIAAALRDTLAAARGFALSLSHDNYLAHSGGTQAVIADEQRKYNGGGWTYLHLSPTRAGQALAEIGRPPDLQLVCDGAFLGIAPVAAVVAAMRWLPLARVFIVHALHGHEPGDVAALSEAVGAPRNVFWAHDYFAACEGYRLLRNGLAFCGAPPPDSMACLVCVHGDTRAAHLARINALFARIAFEVVAPSPLALDIWTRATNLPVRNARAHPHCKLAPLPARPAPLRDAVRVAFVGAADAYKGWPVFQDLARTPGYIFHQFADPDALRPQANLITIAASVGPDAPLAMVEALREARIDFVVMLSPWPETFSLVTMEALAAGADVLTLAASGNAAAIVTATSRGTVFPDAPALIAFFKSGMASCRPSRAETLLWTGTTATLDAPPGPALTQEPDLRFLIDDVAARPSHQGNDYILDLTGAKELRILSRHAAPADVRPGMSDRRQFGVAINRLVLDGHPLSRADARFGAGWHSADEAPFWTNGDARLAIEGAREITLSVAQSTVTWRIA